MANLPTSTVSPTHTSAAHSHSGSDTIRPLLLAGGRSSRMNQPKYLLPLPPPVSGPLYIHLLNLLRLALPQDKGPVYLSLRAAQATPALRASLPDDVEILVDDEEMGDIGPAAGLLAAHAVDLGGAWLVVAVDYPLLTVEALEQLLEAWCGIPAATRGEEVACFVNADGFLEPLLGVWGAGALERFKGNVARGRRGPVRTVEEVGGVRVSPAKEEWVWGANTPAEWEGCMEVWRERFGLGGECCVGSSG